MNSHLFFALLATCAALSLQAADKPQPVKTRPEALNRVRFMPEPKEEQGMVGGKFEGSNVSRHEGFTTLAEITTAPKAGEWTDLKLDNKTIYRWVRYLAPEKSPGKLEKVEFYADDRLLVSGGNGFKFGTFVNSGKEERVTGFDLVDTVTAKRPAIKPDAPNQTDPLDFTLQSTPGATIRYTLDGSNPTTEHGEVYTAPVHLDKTTTITAVAFAPDHPSSPASTSTYLIKGAFKPGFSSAHIGNSLTGTTASFWRYARTAGYDHQYTSFLRGGALTRELWALASGEYAGDKMAKTKEEVARKRGSVVWDDFWGKISKVDLITLQPRDFDLDKEIAAEVSFIKRFREKSPDLQPWLYCEWVEMKRQRPSDLGQVPSYQMKQTFPALTWEESMGAMLLYVEELQKRLGEAYHEGKPARIIPAALAMGWIKNMIDHGQIPGVKPGSFYPLLFNDQVHPAAAPGHGSANGAYLVDLTWYSAFYREPPTGKVLPIETTFTPEQARIVEHLAWDVIKNYPDCGLYEEGTQPCAKPEIVSAEKTITLKSATPGAWFRYTLDGTTPTRTRGYVYCGVISQQQGIQVKAIAYKSGMADSEVAGAK